MKKFLAAISFVAMIATPVYAGGVGSVDGDYEIPQRKQISIDADAFAGGIGNVDSMADGVEFDTFSQVEKEGEVETRINLGGNACPEFDCADVEYAVSARERIKGTGIAVAGGGNRSVAEVGNVMQAVAGARVVIDRSNPADPAE